MNTVETNVMEMACFEVSEHGRLISANKRFCRLFGFEESEIPWHYVTDLYRHVQDWEAFKNATDKNSFVIRMKNRKGRSFNCDVIRETIQKPTGEIVFRNIVRRKGEAACAMDVAPLKSSAVVFLCRCAHCGEHIRVATAAETHLRMLCDKCAVQAYPEAYHVREGQM